MSINWAMTTFPLCRGHCWWACGASGSISWVFTDCDVVLLCVIQVTVWKGKLKAFIHFLWNVFSLLSHGYLSGQVSHFSCSFVGLEFSFITGYKYQLALFSFKGDFFKWAGRLFCFQLWKLFFILRYLKMCVCVHKLESNRSYTGSSVLMCLIIMLFF